MIRCQLISSSAIIIFLVTSIIYLCILLTIGPGHTKENISKALNDKYENIENYEIADDYTGTFTNQGTPKALIGVSLVITVPKYNPIFI